jgi:hypothetical protein
MTRRRREGEGEENPRKREKEMKVMPRRVVPNLHFLRHPFLPSSFFPFPARGNKSQENVWYEYMYLYSDSVNRTRSHVYGYGTEHYQEYSPIAGAVAWHLFCGVLEYSKLNSQRNFFLSVNHHRDGCMHEAAVLEYYITGETSWITNSPNPIQA